MTGGTYAGRCVCGAWLERAWHAYLCFEFNNCFECFPNFLRVKRSPRNEGRGLYVL